MDSGALGVMTTSVKGKLTLSAGVLATRTYKSPWFSSSKNRSDDNNVCKDFSIPQISGYWLNMLLSEIR